MKIAVILPETRGLGKMVSGELLVGSHPPKIYDDDVLADLAEVSTPSLSLFSKSSR